MCPPWSSRGRARARRRAWVARHGARISLGGRRLHVAGIALTIAHSFYPAAKPGLVWLTRADAERLAARTQPLSFLLDLKLAAPATASAFGDELNSDALRHATADEQVLFESWQQIGANDYKVITVDEKLLLIMSWLLATAAIAAIASIAVVVGGRMAEQTRCVGGRRNADRS